MRRLTGMLVLPALLTASVVFGAEASRLDRQTIVRAADTNHDGQIDRVEYLQRMTDTFFFIDANKDGYLTNTEIQATVRGVQPQDMRAADGNSDGKISIYEFHKAVDGNFDAADTNADGRLSMQEVKKEFPE